MNSTVPAFKTELAFYNIAGVFFFAMIGMTLALVFNWLVEKLGGKSGKSQRTSYLLANRPKWAPAPSAFGIIWSILYTFMGVAAYLVRINGGACPGMPTACPKDNSKELVLFWVLQGVLALYVLFSSRGNFLLGGLVVLASLVLSIITTVNFWPFEVWAGIIMILVSAWLAFALVLSLTMAVLNSESSVRAAAKAQSGAVKLRRKRSEQLDEKV